MSKVNKRWTKWILASVSKFFADASALENTFMYIEGQKRMTNDKQDWLEFRMDGPRFTNPSKGCWKVEVTVDIGVNHLRDDTQIHGMALLEGIAESLFDSCIPVYKYPTKDIIDPESDSSLFLNLAIQNNAIGTDLRTTFFGTPNPSTKIEQSTVEATYSQVFTQP